jgi:bile acid:Na+ symporter, BASS family
LKTLLLLFAIAMGILLPQAHIFSFLIQYNLMLLLLFAFLNLRINKATIKKTHFYILAANLIIPFVFYFLLLKIDYNLALAAFLTGMSPTAVAAPTVIHQLKRNVEFTAFSVLLTNLTTALLMPFLLPLVLGAHVEMSITSILFPIIVVFSGPLIVVQLLRLFWNNAIVWLTQKRETTYYILLFSVFLATSKATQFITQEYSGPKQIIIYIALITMVICATSFYAGKKLGGKEYGQEAMQSLGQKNNSLTVWIGLTFINPLTALGPVFYILFHNVVISYQLYRHNKGEDQIV